MNKLMTLGMLLLAVLLASCNMEEKMGKVFGGKLLPLYCKIATCNSEESPSSSELIPCDPKAETLNAALVITDEFFKPWARGGFQPTIFYSVSSNGEYVLNDSEKPAFAEVIKALTPIHKNFLDLGDCDKLDLMLDESVAKNKKKLNDLKPLVNMIREAGFAKLNVLILAENVDSQLLTSASQNLGIRLPTAEEYAVEWSCRDAQTKETLHNVMKDSKFAKDIDKVLQDVAGLQTARKSVPGGRGGAFAEGFAEGYAEGGDVSLADLFHGGGEGVATKAKGNVAPPTEKDIVVAGGSRSAADIMKVARQRIPGLRHIYNKSLKKNPGFQGKVTLTFAVAPSGEVVSVSIASSTTGYGEFDDEVKNAVSRWTFGKAKSGNTTVTIPFTFYQ